MNAERKFLLACLIFALVIYAIHTFGLFDLLTDLPHLQTLIRQSGLFGYSLYILLFIIATVLIHEKYEKNREDIGLFGI